jgi:hypothetical protein
MKHLTLEVLTTKWGTKLVRVKSQTHHGTSFGAGRDNFCSSDGFRLVSGGPMTSWEESDYRLDVYDEGYSLKALMVPSEPWLARLRRAVREYNDFFADKPEGATPDVEIIE